MFDYQHKSIAVKDKIHSHFTTSIPKIEVSFISKKQGSYSKYFMLLSVNDIYYQSLSYAKENSHLFSVKNVEIIDKLADKQKFAKAFMKKDIEVQQHV